MVFLSLCFCVFIHILYQHLFLFFCFLKCSATPRVALIYYVLASPTYEYAAQALGGKWAAVREAVFHGAQSVDIFPS